MINSFIADQSVFWKQILEKTWRQMSESKWVSYEENQILTIESLSVCLSVCPSVVRVWADQSRGGGGGNDPMH